jgi:hypothetical protein
MRLMEADLRFRTQPIPTVQMSVASLIPNNQLLLRVTVQTSSAPLRIEAIHAHLRFEKGVTLAPLFVSLQGKYLPIGDVATEQDTFAPTQGVFTDSHVILTYSDLAGLFRYQGIFMRDGRVTTRAYPLTTNAVPLKILWNKIAAAYRALEKSTAHRKIIATSRATKP